MNLITIDWQETTNKYLNEYSELIVHWLLTSGVKIIFILIAAFILNKILNRFI